jgi:hypothetical protein
MSGITIQFSVFVDFGLDFGVRNFLGLLVLVKVFYYFIFLYLPSPHNKLPDAQTGSGDWICSVGSNL